MSAATRATLALTTRFHVPGKLISDVLVGKPEGGAKPTRIFLLLHGYLQDGPSMARRLESAIEGWEESTGGHALVLAPSGSYPIPERTEKGYHVGYSWYFYDFSTDEYYIDMENSVLLLNGIIAQAEKETSVVNLPITVIGFSQGGYLSPIFAKTNPRVDHVIGIGLRVLKRRSRRSDPFSDGRASRS